jgi:hypothetical protein
MIFNGFDKLKKDLESGLYDFTTPTWSDFNAASYTYEATISDVMRIDLVSKELFGNDDEIEFLMNYNNIDNPLNIMEGDIIRYTSLQDSRRGLYADIENSAVAASLVMSRRGTRIDPNRTTYLDNMSSLTPTMRAVPGSSVNVVGNQIIIG